MPTTTLGEIFTLSLDVATAENIFAFYIGALLLLAYFLSITVSSLHIRSDSVVYPLSRPQVGTYFTEYIIKVKTSLRMGSSFDERGRIIIQLIGTFADSVPLHLKQGKGIEFFLERGTTNIFVYHSPYVLGDIQEITITMVNDAPHEIPFVQWRPAYIAVMQPATRLLWSTIGKKMICLEIIQDTFTCVPDKKERYGFVKALCLFDIWISMMHSPIRFGTYSNFVNVLMIFYVITGLSALILFFELGFHVKVLADVSDIITTGNSGVIIRIFGSVIAVWLIEIFLEALFRNTVPKSSAPKFSKFHGLVEPIEPVHGLNDFTIDYEWDQVWPLVPKKRVIVPYGTRHGSAHSVFPIAPVYSYFNFWGLISREDEREGNWFTRTLNLCALPLPLALKWLAKEAWSLKEEKLIKQYLADFQGPMCFFCGWLQDWPLHYVDNPQQAGLVFSHIICRDILSMTKLTNKTQRARFAQLCLHQWNGLICGIFLYVIKQSLELRNEPSSALVSFIHRHIKIFGKRSPREIQATWKKRQLRLRELQMAGIQKRAEIDEVYNPSVGSNRNTSAIQSKSKFPISIFVGLWHVVCRRPAIIKEPAAQSLQTDLLDGMECVEEDEMLFEDLDRASLNLGKGSKKATEFSLLKAKDMPSFSVEGEGHFDQTWVSRTDDVSKKGKRNLSRRKLSEQSASSNFKESLLEVKLNLDAIEEKEACSSSSNVSVVDSDSLPGYITSSDSEVLTSVAVDTSYSALFTNANFNANSEDDSEKDVDLPLVMEKTKARLELKEERQDMAAAILARKDPQDQKEHITAGADVQSFPISQYESATLGVPYDENTACVIDPDRPTHFLRHRHEIIGYCCKSKKCSAYVEIHKKVGHTSLEVLKKIIQDMLNFAMDSKNITDVAKLWKRKKMVLQVYDMMEKKAFMYSNKDFHDILPNQEEGFLCNQLVTSILTMLETLIDIVLVNKEESYLAQMVIRRKKFGVRQKLVRRCLFCARQVKDDTETLGQGCDEMDKLVKFFSRDTVYVAEREINIELKYKVTVQNYCAMMVNVAKKDVMNELEDPPMVLATKVTRAMIYKLLNDMLPKHTSFKDMTADELRRLGTRRERIQARNDPTAKSSRKETPEEKKKKQMIQTLLEDLGNRWRVNVKENELNHCCMLLAQCLVQERILGFSLYSGLVSEEHEEVLDNSRSRLGEVEKKAYTAILKIARKVLLPRLRKAIDSSQDFDILFTKFKMEAAYTAEVLNVVQTMSEPVFMKTCCFYVDDIVEIKMQEFKELATYMKYMEPAKDITGHLKLKMMKAKYKIDEPFFEQNVRYNFSFSSPILRWGNVAIKGVPAFPNDLKKESDSIKFDQWLPKIMQVGAKDENLEKITSRVLKARRKLKGYLDLNEVEKKRKLEAHLGRVQANLIEQITLASQNISDTYTQETDFQREYHRDELFNVEFYATSKLQVPFCSAMGTILILLVVLLTLLMMFFTTFKTSRMEVKDVRNWFVYCCLAFLLHSLVFEPLKCVFYRIFNWYVD
ncbi:uncharacterized protein LOC106079750 [Biomphalaria glabrata]|uniref:Uncharacterized protein LOC106079750 n=1 Tax=Biomphalaria glabrata TaxID=6526 RepID=A0A9W2ZG10_BIOGL|nr:uncharacterized protein LOC106079750 [Biomphalaria glabrata]